MLAQGNHKNEQNELLEYLEKKKRETEEKFACTARVKEDIVCAMEERGKSLRELNSAAYTGPTSTHMLDGMQAQRKKAYEVLLDKIRSLEQVSVQL